MNETLEDGLAQQLHDTLGSAETAAAWLRTPNPVLAGGTPTCSAAIRLPS